MKFDYCIGNPPYQSDALGNNSFAPSIFNDFMDAAYTVSDKVELVTPAKFLFNAGNTPKSWNEKMLGDEHFKVLFYNADATTLFPNTNISGGIAISYHDKTTQYPPIREFIPFTELLSIRNRIMSREDFQSFSEIVSGRTPYLFTDELHIQYPNAQELLSDGHLYDISSNAFVSLPEVFIRTQPANTADYYSVLGRYNNERVYYWIKKEFAKGRKDQYVSDWKVFLSKANGASGVLVENEQARLISKPEIGAPNEIATDTFLCIGTFSTKKEAKAAYKYILTKFARALLGSRKVTQINSKDTWKNVPLQVFNDSSDIDWSKSIPEIDLQLYKKYGLTKTEKAFIETHVKEME